MNLQYYYSLMIFYKFTKESHRRDKNLIIGCYEVSVSSSTCALDTPTGPAVRGCPGSEPMDESTVVKL